MSGFSFYWHDYETFGRSPRRDRPAQFAGVRTDADLNEIGAPRMMFCRPAPDYLPEPEACLLTGIVPQQCLAQGMAEHAFAAEIESELAFPGTIGVGYNSIRFDDEVTRFLFWRNLIDPYAREWQNECGRWDLLDVLRCTFALRPDGIEWPRKDDDQPSFRLEDLTRANGLAHDAAHDALSDVRATIAMARLVKARQPRLWDFCLRLRSKQAVIDEMNRAQQAGQPFLHVSGMYGTSRGCLALVWPLAPHPTNKNELIVWDLAADPSELFQLGADADPRATVRAQRRAAGRSGPVADQDHSPQQVAGCHRPTEDTERRSRRAVGNRRGTGAAARWIDRPARAINGRDLARRVRASDAIAGGRCRRRPVRGFHRQRRSAPLAAASRGQPRAVGRKIAGFF